MTFLEYLQENRYFFYNSFINKKDLCKIKKLEYEKIIKDYIEFIKNKKYQNLDFSNVFFYKTDIFKNLYFENNIVFENTIFKENIRFDDIYCNELIFKDCEFVNAGGIKTRNDINPLNINKLVFKPYKLNGDFVIDTGRYADSKTSLINTDRKGYISEIIFENHQVGNGRIFIVGLNISLKNGDFRNRILDNVIFQNCDLSNCYFLNSKIDKTEFRSIEFPEIKKYCFFKHIGTADEKQFEKNKNNSNETIFETQKSLQNLYEQLANNFEHHNKFLNKEFIYSSNYHQTYLLKKTNYSLYFVNSIHKYLNGFGQRFVRAFILFLGILLISSYYFSRKANIDFIATHNTPSLLLKLQDTNTSNFNIDDFSLTIWKYNKDNFKDFNNNANILYGYDNRYNFNSVKEQKIMKLTSEFKVGFCKSISNLFYPFTPESKNWFQNISIQGFISSFIETILLWISLLAFFRALWNRIKF